MKSQRNKTRKIIISTLSFLILIFSLLNIQDTKADAHPSSKYNEGNNFAQAVTRLQYLACSILPTQCDSYKPPEEYFTTSCTRGSDVCWNSSSIIGSSADLDTNFPSGLPAMTITNGGDIRYRCRRQKNAIYCFAFRCAEAEPAGCEQMWRIDYKLQTISPSGNDLNLVSWSATSKCVDVGSVDYHGNYHKDYPVCNDIHTDNMYPCGGDLPNCTCP
ncbi:MAG: hypothetical protein PHY73_04230 [Candidatus Omnitrophica bacterium]|nr:hypothetical protein [Candidatus Omnitrophota bacterium]